MKRQQIASMFSKDDNGMTVDEKLASLFQPDTLLSTQYFDNLRRKTLLEPEKRLMLAVLEDAIHCFQDNLFAEAVGKKKLFEEVEQWILERDGDWIFSFDNVCEALGFTPDYVRQGLLRWKEKQKSRRGELEWPRKKLAG
jgi:hypothetical protein